MYTPADIISINHYKLTTCLYVGQSKGRGLSQSLSGVLDGGGERGGGSGEFLEGRGPGWGQYAVSTTTLQNEYRRY